MKFYMPTRLYQERNCVENHAEELAALGNHALIVTGKSSSRRNGSLADITRALEKYSVGFTVFDQVEENPSVETVMAAREAGLAAGADFVVGIGGGSPLDAAKAAAIMMKYPDKGGDYLFTPDKNVRSLPVAAVPTTCGTGSEVTGVAVLTRHDLGTKRSAAHRIFPVLALVDGKYILEAPRSIIVNTAIDALAHLIESGVNTLADEYSDMLVFTGLSVWARCRPCIEGEVPLDEDFADMLMEASAIAGMAIAQAGTSIPHSLSYLPTYEAGVPHGASVGAFLAKYVHYAPEERHDFVLASAGFFSDEDLGGFIRKLAPVNVERDILERSAAFVMGNAAKLKICPYEITPDIMEDLIAL